MENQKTMFKKLIICCLFPIIVFLQSCTTFEPKKYSVQKQIEGRFSLDWSQYGQSTQGRFLWKISTKNKSQIEEFYLMDPWGKTRGILIRKIDNEKSPWVLLNPNHKVIKQKYVESWLKREFQLPYVEFSAFSFPISLASIKIKEYIQNREHNSIIKVVSNTNVGKIIINLLPDK
tara:strand:+ start:208 stop:732 length:525 start_codon:yes stop_codon:yes gene_type:complete